MMATEYGDSHRGGHKMTWPPPKYDTHWLTFAIAMDFSNEGSVFK